MAINPYPEGSPAAQAWGDQFGMEVRERAHLILEEALHTMGLCTDYFDEVAERLMDHALEAGAVAMGLLLEEHGRTKEVGV
jgi:hypothetical protein